MNQYRPLDKDTRIEHVWSSNAIEGSTLNKYETASILNKGMTVHGELVKDVLAAIDLNRLSIAKTHPDWADVYRVVEVWPNGLETEPYWNLTSNERFGWLGN